MEWIKNSHIPIKSWCRDVEEGALQQALDLSNHPVVIRHVALMPDCHVGYGMPIGGVIACKDAVIPNAVGVDIGCGMGAVQSSLPASAVDRRAVKAIMHTVERTIPVGEGHAHNHDQAWDGFERLTADGSRPPWLDDHGWDLAKRNLGTLGGGNHFIELQAGDDGFIWLMIHSGSRNLGLRVAEFYHRRAIDMAERRHFTIPCRDLAYLPIDDELGQAYLRFMTVALDYARENRARIMARFKDAVAAECPGVRFQQEINIHHNYAAAEQHFGVDV